MLSLIIVCFALLSFGQEPDAQGRRPQMPAPSPQATSSPAASPTGSPLGAQRGPTERPGPSPEESPVITKHEIRVGGRTLRYTATTGMMPIKSRDGETEARMFFMAYTLDDGGGRNPRPRAFCLKGGPGSASTRLDPGRIGPKRDRMNLDAATHAAP